MSDAEANERELEILLKARCPLICAVSVEEERVERLLLRLADRLGLRLTFWSATQGFTDRQGEGLPGAPTAREPQDALRLLLERGAGEAEVYVLRDLLAWQADPRLQRQLRDLAREFRGANKTALLIEPEPDLPPGLRDACDLLHFALPTQKGIRRFLNRFLRNMELSFEEDELGKAAAALVGLSELQCESLVARSLVRSRDLDEAFFLAERHKLLSAGDPVEVAAKAAQADPRLAAALRRLSEDPASLERLRSALDATG
ncbi:MAG TPA: hypothetical protein DEA08_32475 [Planctomycetes bacterium]|nr:hypothetical protein [Planctomycetota bacterium]